MRRIGRSACALIAGFLATSGAVLLSDRLTEPAEVRLGKLNISDYCRERYGARSVAQPREKPAFGWQCYYYPNGVFDHAEVDVDDACELLFGPPARAELGVEDDPYGWVCFRR